MANAYSSIFRMQLGKEFESDIINAVKEVLADNCKSLADTVKDLIEGTDLEIYGIPCDITINIYGKDNTDILSESMEIDMASVRFGVRTGNARINFKTPVLVIGVDAGDEHLLRYSYNTIVDSFKKHLAEIVERGQDAYWDWVDRKEATLA